MSATRRRRRTERTEPLGAKARLAPDTQPGGMTRPECSASCLSRRQLDEAAEPEPRQEDPRNPTPIERMHEPARHRPEGEARAPSRAVAPNAWAQKRGTLMRPRPYPGLTVAVTRRLPRGVGRAERLPSEPVERERVDHRGKASRQRRVRHLEMNDGILEPSPKRRRRGLPGKRIADVALEGSKALAERGIDRVRSGQLRVQLFQDLPQLFALHLPLRNVSRIPGALACQSSSWRARAPEAR